MALRFGAIPVSKATNDWLADHPGVDHAIVDTTGWRDPGGTARAMVAANPSLTARELAKLVTGGPIGGWLEQWREADAAAGDALAEDPGPMSELTAVTTVLEAIPDAAALWVASSMPIRQVDLLLSRSERSLRLLANRGASGIDGFISSGIGSAVTSSEPTYLLAGDLSLLHDLTALGWAGRHHTDITMVVINNDGGGIFHLLPQAELPEFEELFGTPHGLDFEAAAAMFDVPYTRPTTAAELAAIVERPPNGPRLVELRFERSAGAASYRQAIRRVADRLPS